MSGGAVMSEQLFWETVYRALMMIAKAIKARYLADPPVATNDS